MSSPSLTLTLPLIYGSLSTPLPPSTSSDYSTHQWTLYIRSYTPLSPYIKSVTFHLHPSFDRSVRVVETCEKIGSQYVFSCTSNGWGEFESLLKITYTQPTVKPTILKHTIRLYPQATTGVVGGGKSTDQRVVNEFYDEICFEGVEKEWYEEVRRRGTWEGVYCERMRGGTMRWTGCFCLFLKTSRYPSLSLSIYISPHKNSFKFLHH